MHIRNVTVAQFTYSSLIFYIIFWDIYIAYFARKCGVISSRKYICVSMHWLSANTPCWYQRKSFHRHLHQFEVDDVYWNNRYECTCKGSVQQYHPLLSCIELIQCVRVYIPDMPVQSIISTTCKFTQLYIPSKQAIWGRLWHILALLFWQ